MSIRLLAVAFLLLLTADGYPIGSLPARFEFLETHMGTRFRMIVYCENSQAARLASRAAFDRVAKLDAIMSDYSETSELMSVCRHAISGQPLSVGEDLFEVLVKSQLMSELSMGAFDVTVGPVVRLWRRARRTGNLPDPQELAAAMKATGYKKLHLDRRTRSLTFDHSGMLLDLGGIAKGYATDQAMAVLKLNGVDRAMIAAGGDILVAGAPPGTNGWVIGIAPIESSDLPPKRYLVLENRAVSTSGDMHQYLRVGPDRFSHIVDPRTGAAIKGADSVTVVATDCVTSDSLATAASVMGAESGTTLVESIPGAAAIFIRNEGNREFVSATKRWKDYPSVSH